MDQQQVAQPSLANVANTFNILGKNIPKTYVYIAGAIIIAIISYFVWKWWSKRKAQSDEESEETTEEEHKMQKRSQEVIVQKKDRQQKQEGEHQMENNIIENI